MICAPRLLAAPDSALTLARALTRGDVAVLIQREWVHVPVVEKGHGLRWAKHPRAVPTMAPTPF